MHIRGQLRPRSPHTLLGTVLRPCADSVHI
nr:MAG TPA: hypothetical protein [Caudoviricetes sp.]